MKFINACKIEKKFSLCYNYYAYIDTKTYLADNMLLRNEVSYIKYLKEYHSINCDYAVIFCRIKKKDNNKFIKAMEELKNSMLIAGHLDYEKYCKNLFSNKLEIIRV